MKFCSHSGDDSDANLITLCATCHALVHSEMLAIAPADKSEGNESFSNIHR